MSRTLYLTEPGALLRRKDGALVVEREGEVRLRLPVDGVGRVVLWPGAQVTTPALRILCRARVDVALLGRGGRFLGALTAPVSGSLVVRAAQFRRFADPGFALAEARRIVAAKVAAQRDGLARLQRSGVAVGEARARLDAAAAAVDAAELETLRGVEGAAARAWFSTWAAALRPPWAVARRARRPPPDAPNALLSFGYTLLGHEVAGDLEARGFDPRLGVYHVVHPGRPALALDLMEPWRPAVDRLVRATLNRGAVQPEDFAAGDRGVRLKAAARGRFLAAYEDHMAGLRPQIAAWVDGFEARLVGAE